MTPLQVTVAQRDSFDELERKSFRRAGGWVPVRQIDRPAELGNLVELGLVEFRRPPDSPGLAYRRVRGIPFIVVLPREEMAVKDAGRAAGRLAVNAHRSAS